MFLAAALVPDTALLVPGAAGRAEVLVDLRARALDAVRAVLATGPERVVVVAPGVEDRVIDGPVRPGFGAAGIRDAALGWAWDDAALDRACDDAVGDSPRAVIPGVAASVGLLLVRQAGWAGPVLVVETGPTTDAKDLRVRGARVGSDPRATAYVVGGSLSARHGPHAPLADDDRAARYDDEVLALIADAGGTARDRLAALDGPLAGELAVSGRGPWQVVVGALDVPSPEASGRPGVEARVLGVDVSLGVQLLVATWVAGPQVRA